MTITVFCTGCQAKTSHLHIHGKTCVCSTCGTKNYAPKAPKVKGPRGRRSLLTIEQIDEVMALRQSGKMDKDIASRFGVSSGTIYNARKARESAV